MVEFEKRALPPKSKTNSPHTFEVTEPFDLTMLKLNAFVAKADGKQVRVCTLNNSLDSELISLGFKYDHVLSMYVRDTADLVSKAALFALLRDLEVCFSDGKEWCPSELFEYLREQNLLHGKFKRVSWTDPHTYRILEV